jgi:AraC-like DNA-binding protein
MVHAGLDVGAIYDQLGYDAAQLPLKELRTRHQLQAFFWKTVEHVSGDRDIGLNLCPHLLLYRAQVLEYLFFSSRTFGDGARRALKYLRLVSDTLSIRLVNDRHGLRAAIVATDRNASQLRHSEICMVYEFLQLMRAVTEAGMKPLRIRLYCDRRAPQADYDRIFGCPVEFGSEENEIWMDPEILALPSPHADSELLQLHEEVAKKRLSEVRRQDLVDQVHTLMSQRLEWEDCNLPDVARELGMSPRRLRFELSRAGTNFSELLADFRFSLARKLLCRTDEQIENIVYLTGFSELSTFYRAFKRWSGMTPMQYRERFGSSVITDLHQLAQAGDQFKRLL